MAAPLSLIVNPNSGRGTGMAAMAGLLEEFRVLGRDVVATPSRSLAHAAELATEASEKHRIAVAIGGDGLVSTIAEAVSEAGGTLAVVPLGRGNDFARSLGIRSRSIAVNTIDVGRVTAVDMGVVDGRRFTCIASMGIDSLVVAAANSMRRLPGKVVYPVATLRSLTRWKPVTFHVRIDGVEHRIKGFSLAVANAPFYGGGMMMAPDAKLDDGLLDVVVIGEMSRPQFLRRAPGVFKGRHVNDPAVTTFRAESVSIDCPEIPEISADGEPIAMGPQEVRVLKGALRLLMP